MCISTYILRGDVEAGALSSAHGKLENVNWYVFLQRLLSSRMVSTSRGCMASKRENSERKMKYIGLIGLQSKSYYRTSSAKSIDLHLNNISKTEEVKIEAGIKLFKIGF